MHIKLRFPDIRTRTYLLRCVVSGIYIVLATACAMILFPYDFKYVVARIIPYDIPPLLSLLCAAFLSFFVLALERISVETLLFSAICLAFAGLNTDIFLLGIIHDPGLALTISRIDHFFLALVMLGANLHLAFRVCEKKDQWWIVWIAYGIGAVMALFTSTDLYFKGLYTYYWGFFARHAVLYDVMSILWLSGLVIGIALMVGTIGKFKDRRRKDRVKYVASGFIFAGLLSLTNTPAIYGHAIYPLGTFTFIPLLLLAYGLYRYNMRIALQRLRIILLYTCMFVWIVSVVSFFFFLFPGKPLGFSLAVGLAAAAFSYELVRGLCIKILSRIFRQSPRRIADDYHDLTYRLAGIPHLKTIYTLLSGWFFSVFASSRFAMVFLDEGASFFSGWRATNPEFFSGLFSGGEERFSGHLPVSIPVDHPFVRNLEKEKPSLVFYERIEKLMGDTAPDTPDWLSRAGVIVPVFYRDTLSCLLVFGHGDHERTYLPAEKEALKSLGIVLGPNIENVHILENLEKSVEERTHDLHSTLEVTREKSDVIERQNRILVSLFEISTKIHDTGSFERLFAIVLKYLKSLFPRLGFGIILEGGRAGILESGVFDGITPMEQEKILSVMASLDQGNINDLLGPDKKEPVSESWALIPMKVKDRTIGKMVIHGEIVDESTRRVISIFSAQVSAVAHNILLMQRLEIMASTDSLTGVANRSCFDREIAKAVNTSKRFETIFFSIIIIDINGLKKVNDNFGHDAGDEMIRKVAAMLCSICRDTDLLSRIGGDEFAILMSATAVRDAAFLLDRIRKKEQMLYLGCSSIEGGKTEYPIRVSAGLAGSDETDSENVLKLADQRMYTEKKAYYENAGQGPDTRL
ncbi:MAG: GGDEF domain-containing protein [Deltaproteobacteria bacterium]|nr:GGDEF domain-containing protein [Deltaproteobacteria bacterium]